MCAGSHLGLNLHTDERKGAHVTTCGQWKPWVHSSLGPTQSKCTLAADVPGQTLCSCNLAHKCPYLLACLEHHAEWLPCEIEPLPSAQCYLVTNRASPSLLAQACLGLGKVLTPCMHRKSLGLLARRFHHAKCLPCKIESLPSAPTLP